MPSPICPFCKGAITADTLRLGGNCPHCMLEIPGEEAPTDPGLILRQKKEQEEKVLQAARQRKARVQGALALVVVLCVAAVGVWKYRQEQAILEYDTEEYYATPLSELESAPAQPAPDAAQANATAPQRPNTPRRPVNGASVPDGGRTTEPVGLKPGEGTGGVAPIANSVTALPTASTSGLGAVDIGVSRLGMDVVLEDDDAIKEMIGRVMRASGPQLTACYNQRLKQVPSLKGKWTTIFTVNKDGTTTAVKVQADGTSDPEFEACLSRAVSSWKFQKIYEEQAVRKGWKFGAW